jgi:hypothetical protein
VKVNDVDVFHPSTGEVRERRPRRDRLLVHRHRLQRGEILVRHPTSSGPTTPTAHSRPRRSRPRSTRRRGPLSTATPFAPSTSPRPAASP